MKIQDIISKSSSLFQLKQILYRIFELRRSEFLTKDLHEFLSSWVIWKALCLLEPLKSFSFHVERRNFNLLRVFNIKELEVMLSFINPSQRIITFHEPWKIHLQEWRSTLLVRILTKILMTIIRAKIRVCSILQVRVHRHSFRRLIVKTTATLSCQGLQLQQNLVLTVLELRIPWFFGKLGESYNVKGLRGIVNWVIPILEPLLYFFTII